MGDGSLSQDEIDALLKGADDILPSSGGMGGFESSSSSSGGGLSPIERDSVADMLGAAMNVSAPSMASYLQKNLSITNPVIEVKSKDALLSEFNRQYIQVSVGYTGSLNGQNLILMSTQDGGLISSLMLGDDSGTPPAELSEAHQSTFSEFVGSLLSAVANQLSARVGGTISTTPPVTSVAANAGQIQFPFGDLVKITYNISIDGLLNSKLYHIVDMGLASSMARGSSQKRGGMQSSAGQDYQHSAPQGMSISPVKFPPLGESLPPAAMQNIGLLMDVQLNLTVELGRTKQYVKDILGLGEGSIIELDKLAGEPVDLLVNNKLIAKGEVVVIDENFGVRITDIVSPSERLTKMNS